MITKVKICGITNIADALAALEAGADALGFVFAESPRQVDPCVVSDILEQLPPFVSTVGVFANQPFDEIERIMEATELQFAQFHAGTSAVPGLLLNALEAAGQLPWRIIRAIHVGNRRDIAQVMDDPLHELCAALLLDTAVEGKLGGTGRVFDWELAVEARSLDKPIILAGGLTPDNVEEAVRKVRPYAVDVSTGVEASPGKKDRKKLEEFIHNAKRPV